MPCNWSVCHESFTEQEKRYGKYDAVICSTDEDAAILIRELRKIARNVPRDTALCGFNNSSICRNSLLLPSPAPTPGKGNR